MPHIGPWTWCSQVTLGPRAHSGVSHGTPFQISTRPSRRPWRPASSASDAAGEHHVAPGLADDPVAAAAALRRRTLGVGGAHGDLDAGLGPQAGHGGGVQLGAARLHVGEVAPGQDVDAVQTGSGGDVADLGDGVGPCQRRPGPGFPGHAGRTLPAAMRLTGERPIEGKTPDSLLALHAAGYREVVARDRPRRAARPRLWRGRRQRPLPRRRPPGDRRRLRPGDRRPRRSPPSRPHHRVQRRRRPRPARRRLRLGLLVPPDRALPPARGPRGRGQPRARTRRRRLLHHARTRRPTSRTPTTSTCSSRPSWPRCSGGTSTTCRSGASTAIRS